MKLIKPSWTILDNCESIEDIYRQIEVAGRVCYKSEDKIAETSAKEFVDRMVKSGHGAMLEHGTVYLTIKPKDLEKYGNDDCRILTHDKYTRWFMYNDEYSITTNYRVLVEKNILHCLDRYKIDYNEATHERRRSVHFVCDRGVSHEYVRHRVFSFAQESTRYCNYSKDKFGGEVTFIEPIWLESSCEKSKHEFRTTLETCNRTYIHLLQNGWTPQQARAILPNALKTELVMTGFDSDWKHFFELRDSSAAHPQARELAKPLHEKFKQLGDWPYKYE